MSCFGLLDLPETLQLQVTELLLGVDLFCLSHMSSSALQVFSEDRFWRPRLPASLASGSNGGGAFGSRMKKPRTGRSASPSNRPLGVCTSAMQAYFHLYFLVFHGSTLNSRPCQTLNWRALTSERTGSLSHIPLQWDSREALQGAVSYDIWFSLAPEQPGCVQGGILLGGQSYVLVYGGGPHHHRQPAIVSPQGTLYCSVIDARKKPIASNLQTERWYHLALSWDNGLQCVYLDGELASQEEGPLHREWRELTCWQVGAGCISGGSVAKPTPNWDGWLGFRGMIGDFHLWNQALGAAQVRQLSHQENLGDAFEPVYSMSTSGIFDRDAQRVRCSRPLERLCLPITEAKAAVFG